MDLVARNVKQYADSWRAFPFKSNLSTISNRRACELDENPGQTVCRGTWMIPDETKVEYLHVLLDHKKWQSNMKLTSMMTHIKIILYNNRTKLGEKSHDKALKLDKRAQLFTAPCCGQVDCNYNGCDCPSAKITRHHDENFVVYVL